MESVDTDGDGRIDFDEFKSAINTFLDQELEQQLQ